MNEDYKSVRLTKRKAICLKCRKEFMSEDPKRNRICHKCSEGNSRVLDITIHPSFNE